MHSPFQEAESLILWNFGLFQEPQWKQLCWPTQKLLLVALWIHAERAIHRIGANLIPVCNQLEWIKKGRHAQSKQNTQV